jgi:hypothetical protein
MPKKPMRPAPDPTLRSRPNIETAPLDVREFDDRAVKYLMEAPENLRGVFRMLDEPLGDRLDFTRMQPMPTSLIPANLRSRNADLLVRVPFLSQGLAETPEVFVFVLAEHQSEPDDLAVFWLLEEMVIAWSKQLRRRQKDKTKGRPMLSPIIPILLYTGDRPWNIPLSLDTIMALPELFRPFVPRFSFLSLNVPGTSREALAKHPIGAVLDALSKGSAPEAELQAVLLTVCDGLEELKQRDRDAWERAIIIMNLLTYHRRAAEEGIRLRSQVMRKLRDDEEGLVIMQTGADVLLEKGERIGIEKGERIGIEKGERTGIEKGERIGIEKGERIGIEKGERIGMEKAMRRVAGDLLRQKFGVLPERAETRLLTMDLAGVQALTLAISSANSLDDLGL